MKINRFPIVAAGLAVFLVQAAQGQDYAFKVMANKGNNEVKSGAAWQPLKTGASLKSGDEIKVADNAYLGLVHASGKPMELKTAGSYKVKDLSDKLKGSGTTVINKYTDFILSSNAEDKKNKLSATGAVHRGTNKDIQVLLPANQHAAIFNSTAVVRWESEKVAGPYVVSIMDMFGEQVAKVETPETKITISLLDNRFSELSALLVEVSSKSDTRKVSEQFLIKKLSPSEYERVKKAYNEIATEVAEATALNQLILAGFYEENNLIIDAIAAYEQAIKLAPDVTSYQEVYDDFLVRQGLRTK